ncbi:uncharacterized protein BDR25DRAFT_239044, partial [Lindgomyces ingoldianus]
TISTRLHGRQNNRDSHVYQQRLTLEQENFLVQWILEGDAQAFPPLHARA